MMGDMEAAVAALAAGGVVVLPTETVYGLSVALSAGEPGLERIRRAKGSPPGRPWILLAADATAAFSLWGRVSPAIRELAGRAWPGPITLVGPARDGLLRGLLGSSGGVPTVSVRVPGDPWLRELLAALGEPIVSTSANRAGTSPPATIDQVDVVAMAPDLAVDRGRRPGGIPSTIVDVVVSPPRLLRAGAGIWPPE